MARVTITINIPKKVSEDIETNIQLKRYLQPKLGCFDIDLESIDDVEEEEDETESDT